MELAVSISSIFIAFVALFLAGWEFKTARDHDHLSVKPYLSIRDDFLLFDPGANLGYRISKARISVENMGSGPARIKSFEVIVDGKKISGPKGDWMEAKDLLGISERNLYFFSYGKGDWVAPGNVKVIFSADVGMETLNQATTADTDVLEVVTKDLSRLTKFIPRLEIKIAYESIYEECDKSTWIGRERANQWEAQAAAMETEPPVLPTSRIEGPSGGH